MEALGILWASREIGNGPGTVSGHPRNTGGLAMMTEALEGSPETVGTQRHSSHWPKDLQPS